jgi:hypothetical protein
MNDSMIKKRRSTTLAVLALLGGCFGLATGWCVGLLVKNAHVRDLSWSDVLALTLATVLVAIGLGTCLLAATRRGQAILANPRMPDFSRPVGRAQSVYYLMQGGVLLLAGFMLATPVLVVESQSLLSGRWGLLTLWALVLSFVIQTALNIAVWKRSDEVFRRVISESGAATFWLFQGIFFLWAAGEKLQTLPAISAWDIVTLMMVLYLSCSIVVSYRRGLG